MSLHCTSTYFKEFSLSFEQSMSTFSLYYFVHTVRNIRLCTSVGQSVPVKHRQRSTHIVIYRKRMYLNNGGIEHPNAHRRALNVRPSLHLGRMVEFRTQSICPLRVGFTLATVSKRSKRLIISRVEVTKVSSNLVRRSVRVNWALENYV